MNQPIKFPCGKSMKNAFMLAPLTNKQSNENGTLSTEEFVWLTKRAEGGFGITMTCASHVQKEGKGFEGQLGCWSEIHAEGHKKLAKTINHHGSLSMLQLHHAGMRSPQDLIEGKPHCPSNNQETGARELSLEEVHQLRNDFILAAKRAKSWGYDGAQIHGAHGYILSQFLSAEINFRTDEYGGSLENRSRIIFEIIDGIRTECGSDFLLSLRLSPERFGMDLGEIKQLCLQVDQLKSVDFLDISLWDYKKDPVQEEYSNTLLSHFTSLNLKYSLLTVAGDIMSAQDVNFLLQEGVDFVTIGKAGILHHDFPQKCISNSNFKVVATPVSPEYLMKEGLSEIFVNYMRRWKGFVTE